ncbi:hypothetical protein MtrunA17_Chr7g0263801 [Medicago truncatula]|uniref:Uncharacterized protein n=1 Tax=Medicago truncatula TaxID=3880 RepID=A0A396H5A6_MEDTR|nr:hypothetical protein MtrunA17_Chr7g0263801 [Medicago truncatula]
MSEDATPLKYLQKSMIKTRLKILEALLSPKSNIKEATLEG